MIAGVLVLACGYGDATPADVTAGVALWYGEHQRFGQPGTPQRWINVLGNAENVTAGGTLSYRVDGGPERRLMLGPDRRRLSRHGDFNIEIPVRELRGVNAAGSTRHTLELRARAAAGTTRTGFVNFDYDPSPAWPLPYRIKWDEVKRIQDVVQVVDGRWGVEGAGLRILEPGYDRAVAIGDARWTVFDMLAEVTLHGIDESGFEPPSNGPGFGFLTRWQGHVRARDEQPATGIWPSGTLVMHRWRREWDAPRFGMFGNGGKALAFDESDRTFEIGVPHLIALRLVRLDNGHDACGVKVWRRGSPEPADWSMFATFEASAPASGSILFVAHHVDLTLGQIAFRPRPP